MHASRGRRQSTTIYYCNGRKQRPKVDPAKTTRSADSRDEGGHKNQKRNHPTNERTNTTEKGRDQTHKQHTTERTSKERPSRNEEINLELAPPVHTVENTAARRRRHRNYRTETTTRLNEKMHRSHRHPKKQTRLPPEPRPDAPHVQLTPQRSPMSNMASRETATSHNPRHGSSRLRLNICLAHH